VEFIPLLVIFGLMYALLILPQQRRAKAQRQLLGSLEVGDQVLLSSGLYGFIEEIHGDVLWLEIADGVEVKVARGAVSEKVTDTATQPAPPAPTVDDTDTEPEKRD
jgi:preprotein translocase subunit YajC